MQSIGASLVRSSRLKLFCLLGFGALLFSSLLSAQPFNFPGGVIDLRVEKQSNELPEARFGMREPVLLDAGKYWRVLVGIELNTLPGEYLVYIKPQGKDVSAFTEKFTIEQKSFPVERASKVPASLTFNEFSELDYHNSDQPKLPLSLPVDLPGQWSENFGALVDVSNSYNKQSGFIERNLISITTTALAPIIAPQNAIVSKIIIGENQLATIFLDHGRGLYSIIGGVSDLSVAVGNGVVSGAVIGKLPPRAADNEPRTITWQCVLNGVYVDPRVLTKLTLENVN